LVRQATSKTDGGGMDDVLIRVEVPSDIKAIDAVNRAAFGGAEEAELVARLRATGEFVLSLVAERDGELVGHVAFSSASIESSGERTSIAWLAPLAVHPEAQHKGIGSALVTSGIRCCRRLKIGYVVLVGDEGFYHRVGFSRAAAEQLESRWPKEALLAARPLSTVPLLAGRLVEPRAFAELN